MYHMILVCYFYVNGDYVSPTPVHGEENTCRDFFLDAFGTLPDMEKSHWQDMERNSSERYISIKTS